MVLNYLIEERNLGIPHNNHNKFNYSFFTIVGSKVIRPDTEYHLSATSQGYKEPASFRVSINGTEDDGRQYIQSKDITFANDQTQTLVFDVSMHGSLVW